MQLFKLQFNLINNWLSRKLLVLTALLPTHTGTKLKSNCRHHMVLKRTCSGCQEQRACCSWSAA